MIMPGRTYSSGSYRYGFNGKEKDNEIKGEGNQYDFGARIYDPRVGRFLSLDRYANKQPFISPYPFASNRPIWAIDYNGDVEFVVNYISLDKDGKEKKRFSQTFSVTTAEDIRGISRSPIVINVYDKDVFVEQSAGIKYWTVKRNVQVEKNSGETYGEQLKREDPVQYYLAKVMINNPLGTGHFAQAAKGKDFFTGEYLSKGAKVGEVAEGILNLVSFGRAGATGKIKELLAGWVIDFFVEEGASMAFKNLEENFGINLEQESVFLYHIANFVRDAKKGELNNIKDYLIKAAEMGLKGDKFIKDMKDKYNIDLNMPKDDKSAKDQVLQTIDK